LKLTLIIGGTLYLAALVSAVASPLGRKTAS